MVFGEHSLKFRCSGLPLARTANLGFGLGFIEGSR